MKVTRILGALLLLAVVTSPVAAAPTIHLGWDICQPGAAINKNFAGPGIYKLVVSGTGFSPGSYRGHQVIMALGSPGGIRDAWRFDAAGCQGSPPPGQLNPSKVYTAAIGKACPGLVGGNQTILFQYAYDALTKKIEFDVASAYETATATTAQVVLFQIDFDHAFSQVGPADPAIACGEAEVPVCIHQRAGFYLDANDVRFDAVRGQEYVTWQDPNNTSGCPGATPAIPSTWGKIKSQYQ